jgi:cytochrome c
MPLPGRRSFGVCKMCHQIGDNAKNAVGPVLNGIIGRKAGSAAGYSYSDANKNSGITWDEATFRDYIKDPKAKVPGTKMVYAGLKDEQKTNDLIAFLKPVRCRREKEVNPSGRRRRPRRAQASCGQYHAVANRSGALRFQLDEWRQKYNLKCRSEPVFGPVSACRRA